MLCHASSALRPGRQLQEHTADVDKPGRMSAVWIPDPQVVRGVGSWEKAFVT